MSKIFTEEENKAWQRTLPTKMSSACIAIRSKGRVLMVKAHYKDHWTFPSGTVDENESPREAALRETREETGVTIFDSEVKFLTVIYTKGKDGYLDRFNFVFCTDVASEELPLTLQEDEIECAEWVDFTNVAERANNRASYVAIQQLLLNPLDTEPYREVT